MMTCQGIWIPSQETWTAAGACCHLA